MLDLHLYQFTYTTDSEQPYYLGINFNNTEVAVGYAPGDTGDVAAFEVTDKFSGEQLALVNINHVDMVTAWHGIVTKAHHIVLELHAEAAEQAKRDRQWSIMMEDFREYSENIDRLSSTLSDARSVSEDNIRQLHRVIDAFKVVADALDLIEDLE